jgi:hypothetical protein
MQGALAGPLPSETAAVLLSRVVEAPNPSVSTVASAEMKVEVVEADHQKGEPGTESSAVPISTQSGLTSATLYCEWAELNHMSNRS